MTLRKPPKAPHATSRLIGRLIGLIFLVLVFALVVWVAATNQQASALERSDPLVRPPAQLVGVPGGGNLHVRTFGRGDDTVVLVHDDHVIGSGLLTVLAEDLASGGRMVVVPDMVGFGLSSRLTDSGRGYSVAGQADTLAYLLDEMEVAQAALVGFGWGGAVGTELAVIRPDLVSSLVLVDVESLPVPTTGWEFLEGMPLGLGKAVAFTREGASDRAERAFARHCETDPRCADPRVIEYFRMAVSLRDTSDSIAARRASARASVAPNRLDEIDIPVLVTSADPESAAAVAGLFPEAGVGALAPWEVGTEELPVR